MLDKHSIYVLGKHDRKRAMRNGHPSPTSLITFSHSLNTTFFKHVGSSIFRFKPVPTEKKRSIKREYFIYQQFLFRNLICITYALKVFVHERSWMERGARGG